MNTNNGHAADSKPDPDHGAILAYFAGMSRYPLLSCALILNILAQGQTLLPLLGPLPVAGEAWGNSSPRMVLDGSGHPVVIMGTGGALHCATWDDGASAFHPPVVVVPEGVFLSDSEGPRMAAHGDTILVTFMVSGEWATGARGVASFDGGATWGEPFPLVAPTATVDHFMPVPAFDESGEPFVVLKVGDAPAVFEGLLRPMGAVDGPWLDPINTSGAADGDAVCECCPSAPFAAEGRLWNVVRNNNDNLRDMWLLGSAQGGDMDWPVALDIDPTDWVIGGCPATGAAIDGPSATGEYWAAFMSAGGESSQARVYWARLGLGGDEPVWLGTGAVTEEQFGNSTQNHPSLSVSGNLIACAWEQNSAGYDIQLSLSDASGSGLIDNAINLTQAESGQHRQPTVVVDGDVLHLVWKNSFSGTVQYLRGEVGSPSGLGGTGAALLEAQLVGPGQVRVPAISAWAQPVRWDAWDAVGRQLGSGAVRGADVLTLPAAGLVLLRLTSADGAQAAVLKIAAP